ncbi:hypothetical protein AURDEDRAFT_169296 [Auricularia subglabra TFB-10046 SS5]|nr:hypothetical protein AURDEDRAFT_169296 [Auricularia subglabra TFB-10046 SS5]
MSLGNSAFRDANVQLLRANHAELLSRIMAVATADHDDASRLVALHSLQAAMNTCSHRTHALHMRLETDFCPERCLRKALSSLLDIVNACFPVLSFRMIRSGLFRFASTWPSQPRDLLPNGPRGFHALMSLLEVVGDASAMGLLTHVFLWCRTAFYAEFADTESAFKFINAICGHLQSLATALRTAHTGSPYLRSDPDHRVVCATYFLHFLAKFCLDEWPHWRQLLLKYGERLILSAKSVLDACTGDQVVTKEHLREFIFQAHTSDTSIGSMADDLAYHMFHDQAVLGGSFAHFWNLLNQLASRRSCSTPDCPGRATVQNVKNPTGAASFGPTKTSANA